MIELYYRIRLFTFLFNHPFDELLDLHLGGCLKSGIDIIIPNKKNGFIMPEDKYEKTVLFNNGATINFWNSNKYYGWMHTGIITFKDNTKCEWKSRRPSAKNMFLFKKALENYKPPIVIDTNPFNL